MTRKPLEKPGVIFNIDYECQKHFISKAGYHLPYLFSCPYNLG